ncbi:hypothetical protein CVT24_010279 [Panaeolus cyanescens]|uniref:Glycolipid transfer protein domain-containing protein n=1 Tax=Panaeolus cyanescens TaxID=181874 RepID=A0A409W8Z6_9AGAR|nr:hypothetical protein CVT24_010279 [Panaeolus cyanescens]
MTPYFETVKSFADVPFTLDEGKGGVDTLAFLEAADGLVLMFGESSSSPGICAILTKFIDLFGAGVFGFIQMDLRNNIHGVRTRYHSATDKSSTLEALAKSERDEVQKWEAIPCLVRLMSSYHIVFLFFLRAGLLTLLLYFVVVPRSSSLHLIRSGLILPPFCRLSLHRLSSLSWSSTITQIAIRSVPSRTSFYQRIAQGASYDKLNDELNKWLLGLGAIVEYMSRWLREGGYGDV